MQVHHDSANHKLIRMKQRALRGCHWAAHLLLDYGRAMAQAPQGGISKASCHLTSKVDSLIQLLK